MRDMRGREGREGREGRWTDGEEDLHAGARKLGSGQKEKKSI
jgi:hypothetical protein